MGEMADYTLSTCCFKGESKYINFNSKNVFKNIGDTCFCGKGEFVLRQNGQNNKYFLGCSTFPKCRYSCRIQEIDAKNHLIEKEQESKLKKCPICKNEATLVHKEAEHQASFGFMVIFDHKIVCSACGLSTKSIESYSTTLDKKLFNGLKKLWNTRR